MTTPPAVAHLDRPCHRAPGLSRRRPARARGVQRRAADARGLHAGRGRRARPRHDHEGGPPLQPRRRGTSRSAARRAASTATRRTRAAYGVLVRYLRADAAVHRDDAGRPARTSASARTSSTAAAAEAGLVSSIQAVYRLLDDEAAARKRLADAFAVEVDGIGLDELVGGCGVAESVARRAGPGAGAVRGRRASRSRASAPWAARPPASSPAPG